MYAKKKVRRMQVEENRALRGRILDPGVNDRLRAIRLKDLPLIEAALGSDRIIVSLDEEARSSFQVRELNVIIWVNPVQERGSIEDWLREGAPDRDKWKLGFRQA